MGQESVYFSFSYKPRCWQTFTSECLRKDFIESGMWLVTSTIEI